MKEMDRPNDTMKHCSLTRDERLKEAKENLGPIIITQGQRCSDPQFEYKYMDGVLGYVNP